MSGDYVVLSFFFFFQAEDGIRDVAVTGVQTCALPIYLHRGGVPLDGHDICRGRALPFRLGEQLRRQALVNAHAARHACVPPTVISSTLIVGRPTPTGTDCPSFPQVPIPSSNFRSLPTIDTFLRISGPLPISVAPFTGVVTRPSSIR